MLKKQFLKSKPIAKVTFRLPKEACEGADSVKIVGDFNEWDPAAATELTPLKSGEFKVVMNLETGKEYQYRYLIDGEKWENDWEADKYVSNEFGEENSVVVLIEEEA